jgi:dTMP kinase
VYQGAASEAPIAPELLAALTQATCGDVLPDRIFVLDVPGDVGAARRRGQLEDRIEQRGSEFQARARAGYLELAATDPRVEVVDAAGAPDAVHAALTSRVEQLLAARR